MHRAARGWLEALLGGGEEFALPHPVIFGFVRIVTNRRVFDEPRTLAAALEDVKRWLDVGATVISPGPRHLELAFGLLRKLGTAGNLTTDVQLAAFALEHQAELHSADADFGRFPGLRWVNPLRDS